MWESAVRPPGNRNGTDASSCLSPSCLNRHPFVEYGSRMQAVVGDPLIPEAAPDAPLSACDCQNMEGGALSLVLKRLGAVVDTQRGTHAPYSVVLLLSTLELAKRKTAIPPQTSNFEYPWEHIECSGGICRP